MPTRRRRPEPARWPLRVYADTSVFGGVHDDEFRAPSERFFTAVRDGAFTILVSVSAHVLGQGAAHADRQ
jgi:hypothetical protein